MKTIVRLSIALLALAAASTTFAVPSGKNTPYQRGSQIPAVAPVSAPKPSAPVAQTMPSGRAGQKFTSQVRCTAERMQTDPACRAHCGR